MQNGSGGGGVAGSRLRRDGQDDVVHSAGILGVVISVTQGDLPGQGRLEVAPGYEEPDGQSVRSVSFVKKSHLTTVSHKHRSTRET